MRSSKLIMVGMVLAAGLIILPGGAAAQESSGAPPQAGTEPVELVKTNGDVKVKLNFQDSPLQTVLEYLSETAGLTVVSDEPISDSRMTVISRQPIPLGEAVALINSILKEKGLASVLTGKTLKVVTLANIKKENIPVVTGRDPKAIVAGDDVVTYIIPVAHVTAVALKENLEVLRPEYASIEANEDSNALIITDTTANIKRLMEIVLALDTHMASVAEIRVFRLTNANATSTATLINNIFQQQSQGNARGRTNTRGGMGGGPLEMMMQMRGGGRGGNNNQAQTGTGSGGGSMNVQVVAAADEQTNSVVVRGSAEALGLVEDIIDSLDDKTAKVADVRVFQLRYADATNAADVINQLFNQSQSSSSSRGGRGGRGGATQNDMAPMMFRGPFGPGAETQQGEGATLVQVTAAADSRTNTVVVTGPESILNVVAGVIAKLDSPIANTADVKVFHLEYADATDTSELINEVFGQTSSTSSRSSRNSQQTQQVRFGMGGAGGRGGFGGMMGGQTSQGGQGGGGSISDVSVLASADARTNSVVVSGPPDTLEIIAQVIKQLDENPEQERRIFVYALKNANATNLMTILNNLFTQMQALEQQGTGRNTQQFAGGTQRGGATGGAQGGTSSSSSDSGDLSEETYFEADPNTNSLLCMTSSKNYDKIKPIIDELDKPVSQVLIKILFAELTHNNSVDLGTEFSMLNIRSGGGSTQSNQVFGRSTELGLPGSTATSPMGLQIRTLEGEIDFTINALQETGRLNVLSRPYVMTRNNQTATIRVVEEVPIPDSETTQGTIGTSTTFTYREDIGIVLEVTPSVNPEGLVNMTVVPQITTRTGETVQISQGLNPVVFATRSASTRVAVMDGQTVVIGGLIEDQVSDSVRKVPLLGDIPLAGALFRRTIKEKSKTELLIFLTPHVAKEPEGLTPISDLERTRSSLNVDGAAAEIFQKHMEGMQGPPKAVIDEPKN